MTGADLQGAQFNATFVATGYSTGCGVGGMFADQFDAAFAAANQQGGTTLTLPNDAYSTTQNLSTYSAGAVDVVTQPPLPLDIRRASSLRTTISTTSRKPENRGSPASN